MDVTRRGLLGGTAALTAVPATRAAAQPATQTATQPAAPATLPTTVPVSLHVNGRIVLLDLEPRVTLLDALREQAGLTGTKKGCGHGSCGACTVHVDDKRVLACLTLASRCENRAITTIEGLAQNGALHPMQAAFIAHDGYQCGYCTPGQIMSAVALVEEGHTGSNDEIREWMSGNLCRCGAYPNIVAAIRDVSDRAKG